MAVRDLNADLDETIDRARQQTDQLHEYSHTFEVLGYGILQPKAVKDEYLALVPPDHDEAVEMLEKQSREVADQWRETHDTVERELLYLFPQYESAVHGLLTGETSEDELREDFGVEPGLEEYRHRVEDVIQINGDYRVLQHRIEDLSHSLEKEGYPSPREIRVEEDRWYSHHLERVEQLEFQEASELEAEDR